ncbi:exchange transporter ClcA [Seminavis robusta]|uniref:Exchange transporter ClcA n=1 Tax=Seminavis robusta TaxID=568900 RepID=A0A9N8HWZ6_9STRA|nr:exchange transporter ClcA [Seminavis robusta]|eukprot:Sro2319_g323110.1 exchange transporter ClcA (618) ;mRNA; f:1001-2854
MKMPSNVSVVAVLLLSAAQIDGFQQFSARKASLLRQAPSSFKHSTTVLTSNPQDPSTSHTTAAADGIPVIVNGKHTTSDDMSSIDKPKQSVWQSSTGGISNYDIRGFRCASYLLVQAAGVGILSGWSVGIFKILTDTVKHLAYAGTVSAKAWQRLLWLPLIPAIGGLVVALLRRLGGGFPPGMKDTIKAVDQQPDYLLGGVEMQPQESSSSTAYNPIFHQFRFVKKSLAAIVTLGTGCSLGPEGPSVEIGMNLSRLVMDIFPARANTNTTPQHQRRLLLACGAAAGVSAGFNAPIAGAFFALEIIQQAFTSIDRQKSSDANNADTDDEIADDGAANPPLTASGSISAVLLASVLSALVCQSLLGEHLMLSLKDYTMETPLLELPLYLLLGATSGLAAYLFGQISTASRALFQGELGPKSIRNRFTRMSPLAKPALGGLICGLVGLVFPQILFTGYDTINIVLANRMLPTLLLLTLLGVKMTTTAVAAGSGLVGGTFAPSLFLGGMVGASFHNIVSWLLQNAANHGTITLASPMIQMADLPAYSMVGAATVLAAVFRAPLTATLLLFELTRDYGAILPLMASTGVASLVADILDVKDETRKTNRRSRQTQASVAGAAS